MKDMKFTILSNREIAKNTYEMKIKSVGECPELKAGQFLNIKLDGFYLRRPFSVCDFNDSRVTVVYKAVGRGTEAMSGYEAGRELQVILPLGNGFDIAASTGAADRTYTADQAGDGKPLVIGGGAGVAPVYKLCRELEEAGMKPVAALGFNSADEIFYKEKFRKICDEVRIATVDGSAGVKGFVTDVIDDSDGTYFYACGPEPMLYAIDQKLDKGFAGEMSFEERMGCGFGACMGCSCETKYGSKRICKDGPVLKRGEILW